MTLKQNVPLTLQIQFLGFSQTTHLEWKEVLYRCVDRVYSIIKIRGFGFPYQAFLGQAYLPESEVSLRRVQPMALGWALDSPNWSVLN